MTARMPMLFIGGPMDGKTMVVEGSPVDIRIPCWLPAPDGTYNGKPTYEYVEYRRCQLMNANAQPVAIYALPGIDIIAALIAHYRPEAA